MPQQLSLHPFATSCESWPSCFDFQDEEENGGERKSLILFIVFNRVNPAQALGVRLNPRVSLSCSSCFTSVRMKRERMPWNVCFNPVNRSKMSKMSKIFRMKREDAPERLLNPVNPA